MTVAERIAALYAKAVDPVEDFTIIDSMHVAALRKEFAKSFRPTSRSEVAMIQQLIRESTGGMKFSPFDLLELKHSKATPEEERDMGRKIIDEVVTKTKQKVTSYLGVFEYLLPLNSQEEVLRTLSWLHALVLAKHSSHRVREQPAPLN